METPTLTLPARVRFPGLSNAAFEHPADRAALETLRRTPGLDRLLKILYELSWERYYRIVYTGDALRVTPRQCRRLYSDLREACAVLDVKEPELYLVQSPIPNAMALGMERYTIVVTTSLLDLLSDSERLYVLGHELGHIKSEHMLYRTMAYVLKDLLLVASGSLTIAGQVISIGLAYAMFEWLRRSELTGDRAGLLVAQDPEIAVSSLLKLTGGSQKLMDDLDPQEFVRQADLYEDMDDSALNLYIKYLLVVQFMREGRIHPFPSMRAREINEWAHSEDFQRILRGDYPRVATEAGKRVCPQCSVSVTNVSFRFCPECGADLPPVTP